MILPQRLIDELITQAREEAPFECCGIIGSRDGEAVKVYPARNVAAAPTLTYELAGEDQYGIAVELEYSGLALGAIYHSHPRAPAFPSGTDIRLAFYPDALYVIIGLAGPEPEVRAFTIRDGQVSEVGIVAGDAPPPP